MLRYNMQTQLGRTSILKTEAHKFFLIYHERSDTRGKVFNPEHQGQTQGSRAGRGIITKLNVTYGRQCKCCRVPLPSDVTASCLTQH